MAAISVGDDQTTSGYGKTVSWNTANLAFLLCTTVAIYNGLELIFWILATFLRTQGLYFWCLITVTTALFPYNIGVILHTFNLSPQALALMLSGIGYIGIVTGQSLVLYLRLGLLVHSHWVLQAIKWMIILLSLTTPEKIRRRMVGAADYAIALQSISNPSREFRKASLQSPCPVGTTTVEEGVSRHDFGGRSLHQSLSRVTTAVSHIEIPESSQQESLSKVTTAISRVETDEPSPQESPTGGVVFEEAGDSEDSSSDRR
jgi:hypothetical protein